MSEATKTIDYWHKTFVEVKNPHKENEVVRFYFEPPQRTEQEPVAWLLTDKNINSLQVDSIQLLINRLKHAHHTDI